MPSICRVLITSTRLSICALLVGAGKLRNIPHNASYVGHYRGVYVWVMPEHVGELTNFSLAILKVAATVPTSTFEIGEGVVEEGAPQYENWFNPLLNQVMTRN